jgi:hypothetical protein
VFASRMKFWQTRASDDGKGTYREMTLNGSVIIENIYLNESALEVVFVKTDAGGEVRWLRLHPPCILERPSMPPHSAPSNTALQFRHHRHRLIPSHTQVRSARLLYEDGSALGGPC